MHEVERYELPEGWQWATLREACEPVYQVNPSKSPSQRFKYVDISSIDNTQNEIIVTKDYSGVEAPSRARKPIRTGDTLLATVRPYLRNIAYVNKELDGQIASTGFCVLRAGRDVDSRFLFRYVLTDDFVNRVSELQRGISYPAVTDRDVYSQRIPLPPLPEQHRIVNKIESLLAEARTARAALDRAEPLLKKFRQAVLAAAFRGELTERDANDEPALALLERIRAERRKQWEDDLWAKGKDPAKAKFVEAEAPDTRELGELPEGWMWASVEQIAEVRLGRQRSPSRAQGPNMRPYLRSANVTWDGLDLSDVKQMDFTLAEQKVYRLRAGDVVLAEASGSISEVGKPAVWNDEIENCCFQNTLIRVRSDAPLPKYLYFHFLYDASTARFRQVAKGIGINHLGAQGLSEWVIAIPPLAEERRIIERIESMFARAEQIESGVELARRRTDKVEQAILARAFRGEL